MSQDDPDILTPEEEARARLAAIIESSDDAIISKTLDGIITSWNRGAERIYGYTAEEAIGQPVAILIPPENQDELPAIMSRVRRGEQIEHYETERIAKDGERLKISLSISPVRDSRGRIIGAATIARDVTMRRREEAITRDALERMQELYYVSRQIGLADSTREILNILVSSSFLREALFALIFIFDTAWEENPPEGGYAEAVWWRSPDIPDMTGMHIRMEDYQLTPLLSRNAQVVVRDTGADSRLNDVARQLLSQIGSHSFIQFPLVAGGDWFGSFGVHWDQPLPLTDEDIRHINGLVDQAAAGIYSLLTLRAEANARREAEKANQLKMKFLAMVSHELRTPLTSIKGFATTLLQPDITFEAADQQEFIRIINDEADNLGDLIEQLLDMTRLEAGTLSIDLQNQSFNEVIARIIPELYILCAHHELVVDVPEDLPPVRADSRRIGQVITNLVDNACKYSPPGSPIKISTRREGHFLVTSIRDEGPGIPASDYSLIFEPFRQAGNRPGHERGTGLGLAIARGVVVAHGGRIWIDEHPSPGTTFCFTLPLAPSEE